MITLKELVEYQKITGKTDIGIITDFFIENDMEEEGMELANRLAKAKIEKMQKERHWIREWAYTIPSGYLYEKYPEKIATMLHRVELDYIVNGKVTGSRLEWAKKDIPHLDTPAIYFQPCLRWLQKNGINFKNVDTFGKIEVDWFDKED